MTDETPTGGKYHVLRSSLPWRSDEEAVTECGRPVASLPAGDVLDRVEARDRVKRWGTRRAALVICMTCADLTGAWPTWEDDPVAVIERAGRGHGYRGQPTPDRRERLARELRAIELLIAAHPDEFTAAVEGLADTATLADARRAKRRR